MGRFSDRLRRRRSPYPVDFGWATSSGRRSDNQDRAAATRRWAVLSDGVGGQPGGARAAELAVAAAAGSLRRASRLDDRAVLEAVGRARKAVRQGRLSGRSLARMDATLTVAVAAGGDGRSSRWLIGWVGDSPAWLLTSGEARCLTTPHTLAAVLAGAAVRRDDTVVQLGRNVLMRSLAAEEDDVGPDLVAATLGPGDGLVVASDGLAEGVDVAAMHQMWVAGLGAADTAAGLVRAAVEGGASDNVTVVVLRHSRR